MLRIGFERNKCYEYIGATYDTKIKVKIREFIKSIKIEVKYKIKDIDDSLSLNPWRLIGDGSQSITLKLNLRKDGLPKIICDSMLKDISSIALQEYHKCHK